MNKKGQGLSVNAIIMIVLGIFVLAVLVLGFTMGWKNIAPRLGGGDNVATISSACDTACATHSQYDFCSVKRELKTQDKTIKDVTCNYLVKQQTRYGLSACSAISCANSVVLPNRPEGKGAVNQESLDMMGNNPTDIKLCGNPENKGKILYVLNRAGDALLNVECAKG